MEVGKHHYRKQDQEFLRSDAFFNVVVGVLCFVVFVVIAYPLWFVVIASVSNADLVPKDR